MDIISKLEKFLLTEIATEYGLDKKTLPHEENLITQGIIDSMGILKLIAFMEKSFGVKIANEEVVPENFQNLNTLKVFIEKKIKK
ncbi:acyl carrier protein [Candidatus Omnitrophota bacterium]